MADLRCDPHGRNYCGGLDVPIVHQCARPDCETLTMGSLCLEHEIAELHQRKRWTQVRFRLTTASAIVAAAAAGALIGSRLPR